MATLQLKMLFQMRGTVLSILAIALLVALLASVNAMVNYYNLESEILTELPKMGGSYLILGENNNFLAEDAIFKELINQLNNIRDIKYIIPQKKLSVTLMVDSKRHSIVVRGLENVTYFLEIKKGSVNGTTSKKDEDANMGAILSRSILTKLGDTVILVLGNRSVNVNIVGIIRTLTQADAELIIPMEAVNNLTGDGSKIAFIEFALRDNVDVGESINRINRILPRDIQIVKIHKPKEFIQEINQQILTFLDVWAIVIYFVVVATSYVVAIRYINESNYEFAMLRALGANKRLIFELVLIYTAIISILGSVLGIALGTAGIQTASTIFGWFWLGTEATPFLQPIQALQTLMITLASATLGSLIPALKNMQRNYMEQPL